MTTRRIKQQVEEARGSEAFVGFEVSWSFGSGDADAVRVDRLAVKALFDAEGMINYVEEIEPAKALKHAVTHGYAAELGIPNKPLIREMQGHGDDTPVAFGIYDHVSEAGEVGDHFPPAARVRIDPISGQAVCLPPEGKTVYGEAWYAKLGEAIANRTNDLVGSAMNKELSVALANAVRYVGAVNRRRNAGGVYLVRGSRGDCLVRVLDALESMTASCAPDNRFYADVTPVYADPRSMKTWTRAAEHDFDKEINALTKELASLVSKDNTRESTLEKRAAECAELMQRAEEYAMLLGSKLDTVKTALSKLQAQFGSAATLVNEARTDGDKAKVQLNALLAKAAPVPAPAAPVPVPALAPAPAAKPVRVRRNAVAELAAKLAGN